MNSLALDGLRGAGGLPSRLTPAFDPSSPIFAFGSGARRMDRIREDKRYRRSCILAAIRRLLMQRGAKGVTIREIATHSGYSVQTLYNLVGCQKVAIQDALAEYSQHVMQESVPDLDDPCALFSILDTWLETIEHLPQYCVQSTQVYYSKSTRELYYKNRQCHAEMMTKLLQQQVRCRIIRPDVNIEELAEQLILFSSASCLEWADGTISFDKLRIRLHSGFASLIANKVAPEYREVIERRLT